MAVFRKPRPIISRRRWVGTAPTYQYARPSSDVTDGSWTNESGNNTNLYTSIDETFAALNDSDYIQSSQSPSVWDVTEVGLSSVADPGTDSGHVVRYRYGKDTTGDTIDLVVRLMQGSTPISVWHHSNIATTLTTAVQNIANAQAANISSYSNLRYRFEAISPGSFGTALPPRIIESPGSTFYISPTGNDGTGDGTLGNPWLQPEFAISQVAYGSVIKALPGTYNLTGDEQGILDDCPSNQPITIEASDPNNKPVFQGARFYFNGCSYFRFRNVKFDGGTPDCIKINGNANHLDFDGIEVYNAPDQGIIFSSDVSGTPQDIQIWNSIIRNNGTDTTLDHGIYVGQLTGTAGTSVIANCVIYANAAYGIQAYPNSDGLLVTGCTIDDHAVKSSIVIGGDVTNATDNARVVGCIFSTNAVWSVRVNWEGTPGTGNNVMDCIGDGTGGSGDYQAGSGVTYTNCATATSPLYVNRAGRDYHLQSGSLATAWVDPARWQYLPATDITGAPRTSPTPGAYNI